MTTDVNKPLHLFHIHLATGQADRINYPKGTGYVPVSVVNYSVYSMAPSSTDSGSQLKQLNGAFTSTDSEVDTCRRKLGFGAGR